MKSGDYRPMNLRPRHWVVLAVLLVLAAIAVSIAFLSSSHRGDGTGENQVFSAKGFHTEYPDGWKLVAKHPGANMTSYALTSSAASVDAAGIPPPGVMAVNIDVFPAAPLARDLSGAETIQDLAARVVATPSTATDLRLVKSVHPVSLGGRPAGGVVYSYSYAGTRNFQKDVVTAHGHAVVFVELDTQHGLAAQGNAVLRTVVGHWRWTGGPLVASGGARPGPGPQPPAPTQSG
jgi:hypothetical protein